MIITYSEGVFVALVNRHTMRMRRIICGLPGCKYYSTLSHKRHDFRKCVIWFSPKLSPETFFILRFEIYRSLCKVSVILVSFWWNLNVLDRLFEKCTNIKFHGNLSGGNWVPCGRTDIMKVIIDIHNFTNAPKNGLLKLWSWNCASSGRSLLCWCLESDGITTKRDLGTCSEKMGLWLGFFFSCTLVGYHSIISTYFFIARIMGW
jgi:hypothetical protein